MNGPYEKLIIKLWETLAEKGVSSLLRPWQIKRDGRARITLRRQELLVLAQAETDAKAIRSGQKRLVQKKRRELHLVSSRQSTNSNTSSADAPKRLLKVPLLSPLPSPADFQEMAKTAEQISKADDMRRAINISKAIIQAEKILSQDPDAPPEKMADEDWLFTWRDYAARVSSEKLQQLWGGILAGEIKSPGEFSVRTLEFLRGLSTAEATQIEKLARVVVMDWISKKQEPYLEKQGITYFFLVQMQELGVLSGVEAGGFSGQLETLEQDRYKRTLRSNGKGLLVEHDDPNRVLDFPVYKLTNIGSELMKLNKVEPDIDYLRLVGKQIAALGFTVYLGNWQGTMKDKGNLTEEEQIEP